MEIFNKSKRTFIVSVGALAPEKNITLPDAEGAKLVKMYENEIIQIGNSKVEKENEELKKEIANLKAKKNTRK